ncbi:MAG: c-type cytochrome [Candidatus Nitrohelix vancouverensis]|uniref:C-type cytochrome n=1 Tax=Candidatus Nitrohelix vancouverensis TaxID=2705534 RepID=A0A7T0G3I1_9BACT|nr:MAG: c-type cytochrome [Candidatus Nitrohelix vancouverensis]
MLSANKHFKTLRWMLLAMAVGFLTPAVSFAAPADAVKKDVLEQGKKIYFKRCVWCHGVEGGGDGPAADRLFTRPRNFIQGTFKIRVTDSGELPLEEDLIKTVTNGLPGSAMPPWGNVLKKDEIVAVVNFVKTLVQDRSFDDSDEEVFTQDFGTNPWGTKGPYHLGIPQEAVDAGKEIFIKNKCFECHGGEGRGDGNPTMKDDWGFPIVAADWQQCWNFRGSRRNHYDPFNVVRTISTGLNGTPMPNFKDQITVEDRWKLAAFVNSLCPRKNIDPLANKPVNDFLISSEFTEGPVAKTIDDPMWTTPDADPKITGWRDSEEYAEEWGSIQRPRRNYIAMAGQITRGKRNFDPKVDNLWVTSRWSEEENAVYYLVEYHDRFLSEDPEWRDMVAIEWPAQLQDLFGAEKPYFIFGDSKKPVHIWRASFLAKNYRASAAPKPEGYELDMKVEELNGNGFDAVTVRDNTVVEVVDSKFIQGRVKVLFRRTLTTENADNLEVQIPKKQFIPVAFMQWSGRDHEKDEHMAISTWYYTILKPSIPTSIYYNAVIMGCAFAGFQGWLVWMTRRTRKMYDEGKVKRDELPV